MRRSAAIGLAALACALVTSEAQAHESRGRSWSEGRAENALIRFEDDVYDADCAGAGRRWKGLYKHFECDTYDEYDEYLGAGRFHVTGAVLYRYVFRWW